MPPPAEIEEIDYFSADLGHASPDCGYISNTNIERCDNESMLESYHEYQ